MGKKKKGSKKSSKKGSKKGSKTKAPKTKVPTGEERLWAKRLQISEVSRTQHRNNASKLVAENDRLANDLMSAERDAIEVISHFTKQISEKDQEIATLNEDLRGLKRKLQEEWAAQERQLQSDIQSLKEHCETAERKLRKAENELEGLQEWSKRRQEMRTELDLLKEDNEAAKTKYEQFIAAKDDKFQEERLRLRKETDAEIAQLAASAHTAAVAGLNETTRSVYTENVRLAEELTITRTENERLTKLAASLSEKTQQLESRLTEAELLAKQSVIKTRQQESANVSLKDKVERLEAVLSKCIRDFENERELLAQSVNQTSKGMRADLEAANRALVLKAAENKRIRHLARYIVEQRSEVETFFHEALNHVRNEVVRSRALFEKSVKEQHKKQMLEGHRSGVLPPIMTFGPSGKSSNSIQAEYASASELPDLSGEVDIRDLTWEQKEHILRRLFSQMNNSKKSKAEAAELASRTKPLPSLVSKVVPQLPPATGVSEQSDSFVEEEKSASVNSFFLTDQVLGDADPITQSS